MLDDSGEGTAVPTSGVRVLRGGAWSAFSRAVPQFYVLAVSITAARFLGPSGMGRQSYIAFVEISVVGLLSSGMFVALMRFVGETVGRGDTRALHGLLGWAWRIEGVLAVLGGAALVAAGLLGATPRAAWLFAAVACTASTVQAIPTAVLIGLQRLREAPIPGLVTGALAVAAVSVVLAEGGGITGMFAVEAAVAIVNLLWTGLLARRRLAEIAPRAAPAGGSDLRRQVARYALASSTGLVLSFIVARRSEFFFLAHSSTAAQISFYSIAFAAVSALVQLPLAAASAAAPAFATLHGAADRERIARGYGRALRLMAVTSLPLTAIGIALGPALLVIVYGHKFSGSAPALVVTLSALPATALGGLALSLAYGLGRLRAQLLANAAAAALDIGLAALLVAHHGAVGAAVANATGQIVLAVLLLVDARVAIGRVPIEGRTLLRALVASAGAGLAGWLAVDILGDTGGFPVGLALAGAVMVVLAMLLRIVPGQDAVWLEANVGGLFGGWFGRGIKRCAGA